MTKRTLLSSLIACSFLAPAIGQAEELQPTLSKLKGDDYFSWLMADAGLIKSTQELISGTRDFIAGTSDVEAQENQKPIALLQVFSSRVLVLDSPSEEGSAVGELFKGQLVDAYELKEGWYRIQISNSLFGSTTGWLKQGDGEYGNPILGVFDPRKKVTDALAKPGNTNQRPSSSAVTQPETVGSAEAVDRAIPGRSQAPFLPSDIVTPIVDPSQIPPPQPNLPRETVSVPDRWRIMQSLGFKFPLYDPYNQNVIKGDLPVLQDVLGPNWFFNLGVISDNLVEKRRFDVPVPPASSTRAGQTGILGAGEQTIFASNLIVSLSLTKGNTTFRPPDYEYRFVPVFNYNKVWADEDRLLRIRPELGEERSDGFFGIQEAFFDYHIRNVSTRYDFDSVRIGIQPFISDFRGFLFQDLPFGIRLFGNRDNNIYQYNVGLFQRIEKDTNSGLNNVKKALRDDILFAANIYRQDFPFLGYTSQLSYTYNRNTENEKLYFDTNGFLARPSAIGDQRPFDYKVHYLGYSGDGHYGRLNITTSTYHATGNVSRHPLAQQAQDISAWFHATELSRDFDWIRLRGSFLYASGDKNPYDGKAEGFDTIFENPQFAGADTSYFMRQNFPLVGGGGVTISGRNGLLPSLRSSKEQGQSNFVNPGLYLFGLGADFDILPELRMVTNVNYLLFDKTAVLGALRQQRNPDREIGIDASFGFQYRPFFSQNVVINTSFAVLLPGEGYKDLFGSDSKRPYSFLFNVIFNF